MEIAKSGQETVTVHRPVSRADPEARLGGPLETCKKYLYSLCFEHGRLSQRVHGSQKSVMFL